MTTDLGYSPAQVAALRKRRARAAISAFVFSAGVHLIFFLLFAYTTLTHSILVPFADRNKNRPKPVRLLDVESKPKTPETSGKAAGDEAMPLADNGEGGNAQVPDPAREPVDIPVPPEVPLTGVGAEIAAPEPVAAVEPWVPRQEILEIKRKIAGSPEGDLARREIPAIPRVAEAPDIAPPAAMAPESQAPAQWLGSDITEPLTTMQLADLAVGEARPTSGATAVESDQTVSNLVNSLFSDRSLEAVAGKTPRPLDELLRVRVELYEPTTDPNFGYLRLFVERKDDTVLPVLPKDIVLVQDSSASIAEKRLYYCRDGMTKCLPLIRPGDRFHMVRFQEQAEWCFTDWAKFGPAEIAAAERFIAGTASSGNTDLYRSMGDLLKLPREKGRPLIVYLVTDGLVTAGVTDSSDIIGEFSAKNGGDMSVFTLGTIRTANWYLLDVLSYCNRGSSRVVTEGRWDIPTAMTEFMTAFSRPVLGEVNFRFASGSGLEVYPVQTSNLYMDQPLVLYGRYRRGLDRLTFQAVGTAGEVECDMVFDVPVGRENWTADAEIRSSWARQKIYYLLGAYARTKSDEDRNSIFQTAAQYEIDVPHRTRLME